MEIKFVPLTRGQRALGYVMLLVSVFFLACFGMLAFLPLFTDAVDVPAEILDARIPVWLLRLQFAVGAEASLFCGYVSFLLGLERVAGPRPWITRQILIRVPHFAGLAVAASIVVVVLITFIYIGTPAG